MNLMAELTNQVSIKFFFCVYLRTGVVQGSKAPPPLTSMPPAISQKSTIRTPVTVPPLSQVSPNGSLNPTVGANQAHGNARTSSFAAALRKLAEQVTEPIVGMLFFCVPTFL